MSPAPTPQSSASPGTGLHPSIVLSAYLEPLVRGRRVAVLGDVSIGLAERLIDRGARLVHAYDPDHVRVAEALARSGGRHPHPTFAVLEGDLGVRDGAFDAVVVPDLSLFQDPADLLRRARRLVSDAGAAVIATPNPDSARALVPAAGKAGGPDYYTLYDLVSLQFRVVRMVGQAPFVGYTVAAFAQEGEPEVSVDMSLLSASEEPEWFIALASERAVRLDPYAVVELPFADLPALGASAARAQEPSAPSPEALAEAEARAARLEVELADLRARIDKQREQEEARVEARAEAAAAASARIAELTAELAAGAARMQEVEGRAGDAHVRAERNAHKIRELDEELRAQRDRAARLAKQLDDEKKARTRVELELGMVRNKPEIAGSKDRIEALCVELDEARARIAALQVSAGELAAARARIADLEAQVTASARPDPALMLRIEELSAAVASARREIGRITGERHAAKAQLEALGRELEDERRGRREAADQLAELEAQRAELARAREELTDRLGRLSREHDAREARRGEREETLSARVAGLMRQIEALTAHRDALAASEARASEAAAEEIAALEEALRERGRVVARLEAELRESERVGRELVDELGMLAEAAGGGPGQGGGGAARQGPADGAPGGGRGAEVQALEQQLATLAQGAARCEADLLAAQWKIAQLERDLTDARDTSATPARAHAELGEALIAARAELEALRRSIGKAAPAEPRRAPAPPEAPEVPRAVIEQAVLLHQVAAAAL